MTVPIEMPDLIAGAGETPDQGGCVMQAAAWLASAGQNWNDSPDCVHGTLRRVAIMVNDNVGTDARRQLWPLVPRMLGTAVDPKTDARTAVQLAVWAAEKVLPLIRDPEMGEKAAERLGAARAWLDTGQRPYADAAAYAAGAAAYAADAAAYAADADAAAADAYAAAYAAAAADAAAYAAGGAAYAAYAAAYAAGGAAGGRAWRDSPDERKIAFLTELLDEHDRLTGHVAQEIESAQWEALRRALLGV
jgi:hypothetical protein